MGLLEKVICYFANSSEKSFDYDAWEENFDQLTKVLIILSKSIDYQKDAIRNGIIAEELFTDFVCYFSEDKEQYVNYGMINSFQLSLLNNLEKVFKKATKKENKLFWTNNEYLTTSKTWQNIGNLSKQILVSLERDT